MPPVPSYYASSTSFKSNGRIADTLGQWYRVNDISKLQPPDRLELYESYNKFIKNFNLGKLSPSEGNQFLWNIRESNNILKLKKPLVEPMIKKISERIETLNKELAKMKKSKTFDENKYRETKMYSDELKEWKKSYEQIPEHASFMVNGDVTKSLKEWYSAGKFEDLKEQDRQYLIAEYKRYLRILKIPNESQLVNDYTSSWAPRVMHNIVNSAKTLKLSTSDVEPLIDQLSARIKAIDKIMDKIKAKLTDTTRPESLTDSQKKSMKFDYFELEHQNIVLSNRQRDLLQIK